MRRSVLLATFALLVTGCDDGEDSSRADGSAGADGGAGTRVTIRNPLTSSLPTRLVVNARDGDGPWMRLPERQGIYEFHAPSGRYTLGYRCGPRLDFPIDVIEATVAEMSEHIVPCGDGASVPSSGAPPPPAYPWTITLRNRDAAQVEGRGRGVASRVDIAFNATHASESVALQPGHSDITALARKPTQVVLFRGLEVTGPGSLDIDFADAVTVETPPIKIDWGTTTPQDSVGWTLSLLTANIRVWVQFAMDNTQPRILPASALSAGERQRVSVRRGGADGSFRGVDYWPRGDEVPDLVLPARLEAKVAIPTPELTFRPTIEFSPIAGATYYFVRFNNRDSYLSVRVTSGWLRGATTYVPPDLSQTPDLDMSFSPLPEFVLFHAISDALPTGATGDPPAGTMSTFSQTRPFLLNELMRLVP
jgi:hypothetical protein